MIPYVDYLHDEYKSKPRASGDDPYGMIAGNGRAA